MAEKPAKAEQVLKIEPKNELHFKGRLIYHYLSPISMINLIGRF